MKSPMCLVYTRDKDRVIQFYFDTFNLLNMIGCGLLQCPKEIDFNIISEQNTITHFLIKDD